MSTFAKANIYRIVCLFTACCLSSYAAIEDQGIADVRGGSMGGADSAAVKGAAANLVNPAALGFMARDSDTNVDNN